MLETEVRHLHHQLENCNHSNCSHVLTGSCHNSFVWLKTAEKKEIQKATTKVSANPTHQNESALWNEVGNGSESTQKKPITQIHFVYFLCLHNETYMRLTVYVDRYTDILSLYLFLLFSVTYYIKLNDPPVIEPCHWKILR